MKFFFKPLPTILRPLFLLFLNLTFTILINPKPIGAQSNDQEIPQDTSYELYPIAYEPDPNLGSPTNMLIDGLIRNQGYQVHCAGQEWEIDSELWNEKYADKFFEQYPGEIATFDGGSTYVLNLADAKVPMYRSNIEADEAVKTSSYEAFFGSLIPEYLIEDQSTDSYSYRDNENYDTTQAGVANHLLTPAQQCRMKYDNLVAVHSICSAQSNTSDCRINTKIRNSNYTRWELFGDIFDLIADLDPGDGGGLDCEDLMGTWESLENPDHRHHKLFLENQEANGLDKQRFNNIQNAINNMSFDIENLYRIAFLVIAPKQDPMAQEGEFSSFYSEEGTGGQHAPIIIAFKVPDFMANRSWHKDSSTITRWALTTKEQQIKDNKEIDDRRNAAYNLVLSRLHPNPGIRFMPEDPIYCPDLDVCQRYENDPDSVIRNAVIDMVNALGNKCIDEQAYEEAGDIYTPAQAHLKTPHYSVETFYPTEDLIKKQEQSFTWQFNVRSKQDYIQDFQNDQERAHSITVNAYIVAPYGVEQELLFNAMQGLFTPEQNEQMLEDNLVIDSFQRGVYPEFLTIKDAEFGIENNPYYAKFGYVDTAECEWHWDLDPTKPLPEFMNEDEARMICQAQGDDDEKPNYCIKTKVCPYREFGKGVDEQKPDNLTIYGAKVGWSIRKIQEAITAKGSSIYGYFSSCNRIEDLFLGRCGSSEPTDLE